MGDPRRGIVNRTDVRRPTRVPILQQIKQITNIKFLAQYSVLHSYVLTKTNLLITTLT
jgi:hypothetical protein